MQFVYCKSCVSKATKVDNNACVLASGDIVGKV